MGKLGIGYLVHFWFALVLATSFALYNEAVAGALILKHDLSVELDLSSKKILARDNMLVSNWQGKGPCFQLAKQSHIKSVTVRGRAVEYSFGSGRLTILSNPLGGSGPLYVAVAYEVVFDDRVPDEPASFDNPGFGVKGTISEKGAFLLPGSGWYPVSSDSSLAFHLEVLAPRGIYAVTAGRLVKHEDRGGKSISVWDVSTPVEGLALCAGPYIVRSRMSGDIQIYTYFFPQTDPLSEKYLLAASSHIQFYEKLLGPYPFPKFAVVENFFPTGYGFPSFTLLGTSVLALPFIPETSLKHEVAHSWWGNSVFVDYESGNWSEGLTTYVSDYLSQELVTENYAKIYRRQILEDYSNIVEKGGDFPLRQFKSRTSPVSKAVGYGKAAFVFHMVRKKLGDDLFWRSLRSLFNERRFKKTSWDDIRDIFVRAGTWDSGDARQFFDQWLARSGAPILEVKEVQSTRAWDGWNVKGVIGQGSPQYLLDVTLRLEAQAEKLEQVTCLTGVSTAFDLQMDRAPRRLVVDPEYNLFRLLYPVEIPATVNSLKGSKDLVAIFGNGISKDLTEIFKLLLESLNQGDTAILTEAEVDPISVLDRDFLFFGLPQSPDLKALFSQRPEGLRLSAERFSLDGVFSSGGSDCMFVIFRNPGAGNTCVALFMPVPGVEKESLLAAARKITHYGKFSYLSFHHGINQAKGFWPVSFSPLAIEFEQTP